MLALAQGATHPIQHPINDHRRVILRDPGLGRDLFHQIRLGHRDVSSLEREQDFKGCGTHSVRATRPGGGSPWGRPPDNLARSTAFVACRPLGSSRRRPRYVVISSTTPTTTVRIGPRGCSRTCAALFPSSTTST